MRGSLNKPRNKKAAQQSLEKAHTKKSRESEGPSFSEGQSPGDQGNQQDDANINAIFLPGEPRWVKRMILSDICMGGVGRLFFLCDGRATLAVPSQIGANSNAVILMLMESLQGLPIFNSTSRLDKTKSNSTKGNSERLKLTPWRGGLKSNDTQTRVSKDGEKGNPNMDAMSLPNMLRFLESEETLLTQLQSKMSAELSRLQVEEHVFLHTLKILGQKHASANKVQEQQETSSGDQDFIDALNEALMENGESMPSNEDKGEGTF